MLRLIRVTTILRVPVFVHWSVPAVCIFFLGAGLPRIVMVAAALSAYVGTLVVHELGHHIAAVRRGYHVERIEVFPLHATCRFEHPDYLLDHAAIAWGGPLAQLILAFPFTVYILLVGFTRSQTANAILAILGYFNPLVAVVNLIPMHPLDGKIAWAVNPLHVLKAEPWKRRRPKSALETIEDIRQAAIRKAAKK
jgi:Zn-dependent protease